jgi:hypothetical protein
VAETWILLSAALALALEYYRVPHVAKAKLIEALRQGKIRWRCAGLDGFRYKDDPGDGDPHFWCDGSAQPLLRFDWEHDYVRRHRYGAYRIEVVREEVQAWLRTASQPEPALEADPSSGDPLGTEPAQSAEPPKLKPEPKPVSDEELRDCVLNIPPEWLFTPGRIEDEVWQRIENDLGRPIQRERIREALRTHVEGYRGRGRPRKSTENDPNNSP